MGMVNRVVPHAELDAEVDRWCKEILALSPTAIAIAKRACNAKFLTRSAASAPWACRPSSCSTESPESKEGVAAFREKRAPRFR